MNFCEDLEIDLNFIQFKFQKNRIASFGPKFETSPFLEIMKKRKNTNVSLPAHFSPILWLVLLCVSTRPTFSVFTVYPNIDSVLI